MLTDVCASFYIFAIRYLPMQVYYISPLTSLLPCHATLGREESHHCIRVLRKHNGDSLHLTDGLGNLYLAAIVTEDASACLVQITELLESLPEKPYRCHIAVAPTKNISRFEWFLEKATEIGVDEITPLICSRSEKMHLRHDRLGKIIQSAALQSVSLKIPKLNKAIPLNDFVASELPESRFVAYVEEKQNLVLKKEYKPNSDCVILIGPEGDFTPQEIELAIRNKFVPVSLGRTRLRTETAALVAVHTIALLND